MSSQLNTSFYSKNETDTLFVSNYDKNHIDTSLYLKTSLYNKTEIDTLFTNYYNTTFIDAAFSDCYLKASSYNKQILIHD